MVRITKKEEKIAKGASPLVKQIIGLILEEIEKLNPGLPLPNEIELSEKFGVSRKTLRAAMKRLEDDNLIRRIKRKGTFPTSGPNTTTLFRQEVGRIGIICPKDIFTNHQNYLHSITSNITNTSINNNFQTLFAGGTNENDLNDSIFRLADDKSVDGIILLNITNQQLLFDLEKWNKPICLIDHYSNAKFIDCMRTDSVKGSLLAIEHLFRLGHRKIAYANTINKETNPARLEGFMEGLKKWKLTKKDEWIFSGINPEKEAEEIATQYLSLDINNRPTAIVAFSDIMANKIIKALLSFGLKIPENISIIGTKGANAKHLDNGIKLTSVCFQWDTLGSMATECIIDRIKNPRKLGKNLFIPPSLEINESTCKHEGFY